MVKSYYKRWLALSSQGIETAMKSEHLIHIIAFGEVTSNGDVVSTFFFSLGLRLNTEVYIKCQTEIVIPLIEKVPARGQYIWKQDSDQWHKQENQVFVVITFLRLNYSWHMPPSDCNLLNYNVWGHSRARN